MFSPIFKSKLILVQKYKKSTRLNNKAMSFSPI